MPISGEESSEFFKMTSEFETEYNGLLCEASGGCLHLEFLHETEEDAKRMCEDKDFIQDRFVQFMTNVGKDASSCTIEATYKHITSSPKPAVHIPQGNKDPYGPSESGDAKGIVGTTFDDDSSPFTLDGSGDRDRQTHNVLDTKIPSTSAEEDSENEDTSTQIQSTQLASYSRRYNQAEMGGLMKGQFLPSFSLSYMSSEGIGGTTLDGSEDSDRQTHNVLDTKIRSTSAEEDSENEDTSTQIQSTRLPSYSKTDYEKEMGTGMTERHVPFRNIMITGGHMEQQNVNIPVNVHTNFGVPPCRHCHKFRRERQRGDISEESLEELARSALRLHPLPAEVIKIYGCDTCDNVTEEARHECELGKHVFFIHPFVQSRNKICTCELKQKYHMKKILSALRNKHGGILYVHSPGGIEDTRSFVDSILSTLTSPGEIFSDVFECEFDETCPNILRIDVERSATFITADLKTKQPTSCLLKYQSVSLDTLKSRLFSQRTVQNTAPTLQGVSYIEHGKAVVKLYTDIWTDSWLFGYRSVDRSLSDYVSDFVDEVHLSEYVSSLSNRRNGGNIFVGGESFRSGKLKGDMRGLNIVRPGKQWEDEFKRALEQELVSRICVFRNTYSDVNDVFTIGIHNTGDGKYIIEVAVRPVNGCVFHDALGPASFELEEREIAGLKYDACVRLSFDDWLKKTFPEMKIGNTEHT